MARTNSSFKLSKDTKRILSTIMDKTERNIYKTAMIDAEHSYIVNRHRRPSEKSKNSDSE